MAHWGAIYGAWVPHELLKLGLEYWIGIYGDLLEEKIPDFQYIDLGIIFNPPDSFLPQFTFWLFYYKVSIHMVSQ